MVYPHTHPYMLVLSSDEILQCDTHYSGKMCEKLDVDLLCSGDRYSSWNILTSFLIQSMKLDHESKCCG